MISDLFSKLLFPFLLVGGLLVPGWLLGRALRTPAGVVGGFVGSAALLLNLLLTLDALSIRLDAFRFTLAVALLNAGLLLVAKIRQRLAPPPPPEPLVPSVPAAVNSHFHYILLAPIVIGLVAIGLRAGIDPLSGYDTSFRWDFLAQQIFREGSLNFYPPILTEDFLHYGWCDGIAPMVSTLYLWSYFSLGRIATGAATTVVFIQAALVFWLVWQLAARRAGPIAGLLACALISTSSALLWGVAMGQETGLTALSTLAMFYFFEKHREQLSSRWLVWAGLAAGVGALAREYGLILIPLGVATLAWWRTPKRRWLEFALIAMAVTLPWYLRNEIKTGHPLYSYSLGGLFPTNPIQLEYFRVIVAANGIFTQPAAVLPLLGKLVALVAIVPIATGLIVGLTQARACAPWLTAAVIFVGLWLWSIGQTSGGYTYSTRVLTPTIALCAVMGGIGLTRIATMRWRWILALIITIVSCDAAVRSLYLPVDVQPPWWRIRFFAWRDFGLFAESWRTHPNWNAIRESAEGRYILVSDPAVHAVLARVGAKPVPFYSPSVRFLFDSNPDLETGIARLRQAGFRFIIMTRNNGFLSAQLAPHSFFSALSASPPVAETNVYYVYDLYSPKH